MTDDELETQVREALATRDPGTPAPAALRERVGQVPSARFPVGSLHAGRYIRAAGALLATAAAVVLGILGVSALRNVGIVAAPAGAASPSPSAGVLLGPVTVATPLALEPWMASSILGALVLVGWFIVEGLATPAPVESGDLAAPWRFPRGLGWLNHARLRRTALGCVLIVAVAAPNMVGAVATLSRGSVGQSSSVNLLGGRISFIDPNPVIFYGTAPGSTASVGFSMRNDGSVPVIVLGLDPSVSINGEMELRRFTNEGPDVEQMTSGDQSVDESPTVPFTPFELQPGAERFLVFVEKTVTCGHGPTATPGPTTSPAPSLDMENYYPTSSGGMSTSSVWIRYSALGIAQTAEIEFGETLVFVCPA